MIKSRIFFRFLSHCFWFPSGSLNYVSLRAMSCSCLGQNFGPILVSVKPWPNGLALNLHFVWPPTCVNLWWLATTCVDFGQAQISTQVEASFHYLATQCKSTQVDCKSTVYAWNLRPFTTCVNLQVDLQIYLATLRKSIHKFWFCKLASTCESVWPGL